MCFNLFLSIWDGRMGKKFIQKTINLTYENIFTIARNDYSDGRNSLV